MSNLRETYKWIDEYNDKNLTPPPSTARFIEIVFDGEVKVFCLLFILFSIFQVHLFYNMKNELRNSHPTEV